MPPKRKSAAQAATTDDYEQTSGDKPTSARRTSSRLSAGVKTTSSADIYSFAALEPKKERKNAANKKKEKEKPVQVLESADEDEDNEEEADEDNEEEADEDDDDEEEEETNSSEDEWDEPKSKSKAKKTKAAAPTRTAAAAKKDTANVDAFVGCDETDYDEDQEDEDDYDFNHKGAWDTCNEDLSLEMQQYADNSDDCFDYIEDIDFWGDNDSWMFEGDVVDIKIIANRHKARTKMFNAWVADRQKFIQDPVKVGKTKSFQELAQWNSFTSKTKNKTNKPAAGAKVDEFLTTPDAYHYCAYCDEFTTLSSGKGPTECHDVKKHTKYCNCNRCKHHVERRLGWINDFLEKLVKVYVPGMAMRYREACQYERQKDRYFSSIW